MDVGREKKRKKDKKRISLLLISLLMKKKNGGLKEKKERCWKNGKAVSLFFFFPRVEEKNEDGRGKV